MQPAVELSSFPLKSLEINAVSSSRECCEAGSLVAMGDSFAGLATSNKRKNLTISSTDPPQKKREQLPFNGLYGTEILLHH